jgi:hypothetical protein
MDDPRIRLHRWVPGPNEGGPDVFHTGDSKFIIAGNGYRLCPALLVNKELYMALWRLLWSKEELLCAEEAVQKRQNNYNRLNDQILQKDWERSIPLPGPNGDWDDEECGPFQIIEDDVTKLIKEASVDLKEGKEFLQWSRDRHMLIVEDLERCLLRPFADMGSFLYLEKHLPRYQRRRTPDEETVAPYDDLDCAISRFSREERNRWYEHLQNEFDIHRDGYYFQFKQWATPFLGKKDFDELEDEFGPIWLHRTQKMSQDLQEAEDDFHDPFQRINPARKRKYREAQLGTGDDQANFPRLYHDRKRRRIETWRNAESSTGRDTVHAPECTLQCPSTSTDSSSQCQTCSSTGSQSPKSHHSETEYQGSQPPASENRASHPPASNHSRRPSDFHYKVLRSRRRIRQGPPKRPGARYPKEELNYGNG